MKKILVWVSIVALLLVWTFVHVHWAVMVAVHVLAFFTLVVPALRSLAKRRRRRQQWQSIFDSVFGPSAFAPTMSVGSSYGYPEFRIKFSSKDDHDASARAGLHGQFSTMIGPACRDIGRPDAPFNPRLGVLFLFPGWVYYDRQFVRFRGAEWAEAGKKNLANDLDPYYDLNGRAPTKRWVVAVSAVAVAAVVFVMAWVLGLGAVLLPEGSTLFPSKKSTATPAAVVRCLTDPLVPDPEICRKPMQSPVPNLSEFYTNKGT